MAVSFEHHLVWAVLVVILIDATLVLILRFFLIDERASFGTWASNAVLDYQGLKNDLLIFPVLCFNAETTKLMSLTAFIWVFILNFSILTLNITAINDLYASIVFQMICRALIFCITKSFASLIAYFVLMVVVMVLRLFSWLFPLGIGGPSAHSSENIMWSSRVPA
ncbi:hypothetical protein COLO4_31787 [Corchorus olitorius]|uniref:Uncharacterized protein n=1 Tax=Corchorus olitorius TaxID=93759 RepID=A0A1R3H397_9ROSI|nr:hypothetical protein COLO4_31787 [Corchorus olitorius]